ncbi:type II toxin-antitoxin system death-on-curing family toxin [Demequina aestuarii]|uniref:type II toxin-antitoxin system death-on-curing family toxin n=1 Tax=Demequina aestuarii TaxID=327095 RepID=UPI0007820EA1|nr:type II toxin-antitoxin system death-on-curing family toxin [Demequina aestuarii]
MTEPVIYPSFAVAVKVIRREGIGPIRDDGLLDSALMRPSTTVMGADAYPSVEMKAAALLHSLCLNHPLVDGNKRLAALLAAMFLYVNGRDLALSNDELFDLTMAVASGDLRDVEDIAARLRTEAR